MGREVGGNGPRDLVFWKPWKLKGSGKRTSGPSDAENPGVAALMMQSGSSWTVLSDVRSWVRMRKWQLTGEFLMEIL